MVKSTVRQTLLDALHPDSGSDVALLELLKKEDLAELFQALPKKDYGTLWDLVRQRLHRLLEEEYYCNEHPSRKSELALMDAICTMAKCFVDEGLAKTDCPKGLVGTTQSLHGVMFKLRPEESYKLQNKISQLCEAWWKLNLPDKSLVVPQTISYLLVRSIEPTSLKADIARVNQMKESLMLLDLDDESGDPLKHLLLRCFLSPLYLRSAEGRKFLSFAFTVNLAFVDQLILTINNQLPLASASIVGHYGEVLFRAWRVAQGQLLLKLEQVCLQRLIHCGIHVANGNTAKAVRLVLHAFHENKKQKGVDEMLHRLYAPILWRCMNVANPIVRRNAAALFVEAFPVQDPTDGVEQTDLMLQKQFQHLRDILGDNDEQVRAVGVKGVCRVLSIYWELIPPSTIKTLVDCVLERAFDGSSFAVRAAVPMGVAFVLENVLTHEFFKLKLSVLQPLIYDSSPRVQVAFLDLLLLVKKMRDIRFVDIVPVELLLKRLEVCSAPVCLKIAELLMSYFPQDKPLAEQVRRAWALLRKYPQQGKLFFNYVHKLVPLEAILNLLNGFHQFLKTGKDAPASEGKSKKSKGEPAHSVMWQKDQTSVEALLCTMAQLWHNVRREAAQAKKSAYKDLLKNFEEEVGDIQSLLGWFPSEVAGSAILTMATFLPRQTSNDLLPKLRKLPVTASVSQFGPPIECLFSWGKASEVVALVVAGLQEENATIDAPTALKYFTYILENQRTRIWLLQNFDSGKGPIAELKQFLTQSLSDLKDNLESGDLGFSIGLLELLSKVQIHLYALRPDTLPTGLSSVLDLMDFISTHVLPALCNEAAGSSTEPPPKRKPKASHKGETTASSSVSSRAEKEQLVVLLAKLCTEIVTLGLPPHQFVARMSRWGAILGEKQRQGPVSAPLLDGLVAVWAKLSVQLHIADPEAAFTFISPLLPLFSASLANDGGFVKVALAEIVRTAKDRKSNLIRTVGFFVAVLLTGREGYSLQPLEVAIVSTLVRIPAAIFCLPQVLEKLCPPTEPAGALSLWIGHAVERLADIAQGVKEEVSTLKARADFVHCLRVCVATLNLLQSDTADLQRGCLAAAAHQQTAKRASANLQEDSVFTVETSEALKACSRPALSTAS